MNKFQTTPDGLVSSLIWSVVWLAVFAMLAAWAHSHAITLAQSEFSDDRADAALFIGGMWAFRFAMLITILTTIHQLVYGVRGYKELVPSDDGKRWAKVISTSFHFLAGRSIEDNLIDRIVSVSMHQSTIDRGLGVGDITIRYVVYTNTGSEPGYLQLTGIKNPADRLDDIRARIPMDASIPVHLETKTD